MYNPALGTNNAGAFSKSYLGINLLINPHQEFLTSLLYLNLIPDDKNLGFMLNTLCNIEQTDLLAETECKGLTLCHSTLDFHNLLWLVKALLTNSGWELLDKLNNDY